MSSRGIEDRLSASRINRSQMCIGAVLVASAVAGTAFALDPPVSPKLAEGSGIVRSKAWAIVLGKALFWDQQAGSDGAGVCGLPLQCRR